MKPALKLMQTPAQPGAVSFDRSRPAPHTEALRAAWWDGHAYGFREAWTQGVRWGIVCGCCTTVCLAAILGGIAAGFGWL